MAEQPELDLLAKWEAERAELDVMIAGLRRRMGLPQSNGDGSTSPIGSTTVAVLGMREPGATGQIRSDEFFRLSNPEAIKKFLSIMKRPQSPKAIVDGLKAGGVLSNAKNFYANIWTELKRAEERGEVVNTPSGWGLAEWYPVKPKPPEPKSRKQSKKKGKKKPSARATAASGTSDAPARPTERAGGWNAFLAEQIRSGKTMKEAAEEWKKRKAAQG